MFRFVIRTTKLYKYSGNLTEDIFHGHGFDRKNALSNYFASSTNKEAADDELFVYLTAILKNFFIWVGSEKGESVL